MAISLVQTKLGSAVTGSTTQTIVPTSSIVANNTLILCSGVDSNISISSVTDSAGNSWAIGNSLGQGGFEAEKCEIWYAPITVGGGTTPTLTVTYASSGNHNLILREYSGLAASPLDVVASNTSSGSFVSSQNGGTTTTTAQANELIIGGIEGRSTTGSWTFSAGTGFGNLADIGTLSGGTFARLSMIDQIVSATGTQSALWTSSATADYTAVTVTFKGDTSGGGSTPPPSFIKPSTFMVMR